MFLKYIALFLGIIYFVFAAVLLLKTTPIRKANKVLCFLFVLMAVYSIELSFYYTALLNKYYSYLSYYVPFDLILLLLFGPILFLYVKVLLGQPIKLNLFKIVIQALPFIPALAFIIYFLGQDAQTRLNLLIINFEQGIWHTNMLNILVYVQMTIYLILCYIAIQKQFKTSTVIIVNNIQMDVSWLRIYVLLNLIFMLLSAPLSFYLANEKVNLIIAQLAMVIQFVYLFLKSAWQNELFLADSMSGIKCKEPVLVIADDLVENYYKTLMGYIENSKPYLKEDCSIQSVSEDTKIPVHHLSNILNKHFQKNFPEFINEYRILEAKKLLSTSHSKKMTLESIGYECGFGSKSSFNKAFKKHTNLTPSKFRQLKQRENVLSPDCL